MKPPSLIPPIFLLDVFGLLGGLARPVAADWLIQADRPLRVATKPLEPFVIKRNDRWAGFSIDPWDKIALQLKTRATVASIARVSPCRDALEHRSPDRTRLGLSRRSFHRSPLQGRESPSPRRAGRSLHCGRS